MTAKYRNNGAPQKLEPEAFFIFRSYQSNVQVRESYFKLLLEENYMKMKILPLSDFFCYGCTAD